MNNQNSVTGALASAPENPFLRNWTGPFAVPPFGEIAPEHFRPAFERALAEHEAEVEAVAKSETSPTFENTVEVLERSGEPLTRLLKVFYSLSGAHTNDALLAPAARR
jgi:peptidyl-dipeptidase Dcp